MGQQALFSQLKTVKTSQCYWEITSAIITQENTASVNQKCFSLKLPFGVFHRTVDICFLHYETRGGECPTSAVMSSCSMFLSNKIYTWLKSVVRPRNLQPRVSWLWTNTVHFRPKPNLSFFLYKTSQSLSPKSLEIRIQWWQQHHKRQRENWLFFHPSVLLTFLRKIRYGASLSIGSQNIEYEAAFDIDFQSFSYIKCKLLKYVACLLNFS